MSPEQVAMLTAIAALIGKIGTWPLGLMLLAIIVGPWMLAMLLAANQQKRFEAVVEMYKNNVKLLEKDQAMANDLKDIIIMNTTTMTRLVDRINGAMGKS